MKNKLRSLKLSRSLITFILVSAIVLSTIIPGSFIFEEVDVDAATNVTVDITGKRLYSVANGFLSDINALRAESDTDPIQMDADLQEEAMNLAAQYLIDKSNVDNKHELIFGSDGDESFQTGKYTGVVYTFDADEISYDSLGSAACKTILEKITTIAKDYDSRFIRSMGIGIFMDNETDDDTNPCAAVVTIVSTEETGNVSTVTANRETTETVSICTTNLTLSPGPNGSADKYDTSQWPFNNKNGDSYRNKFVQAGDTTQLDVHVLDTSQHDELFFTSLEASMHYAMPYKSVNIEEDSVRWSSSDTSIATVNANGKVTAKKAGTVKVTATLGNMSCYYNIYVTSSSPSSHAKFSPLLYGGSTGNDYYNCYKDGKEYYGSTKGYDVYQKQGNWNNITYTGAGTWSVNYDFNTDYYCCNGRDSNGNKGCEHGFTVAHIIKASEIITTNSGSNSETKRVTSANAVVTVNASTMTATYVKPITSKATITIPATVKTGGKTYKVTKIKAGAFKNNTTIKKVVIGKNVKKIGKKAFYGCSNLKKIKIKSTVLKSVGAKAITGIKKNAKITVPKSKYKAYKKLFKTKTGYKKTMKITKN